MTTLAVSMLMRHLAARQGAACAPAGDPAPPGYPEAHTRDAADAREAKARATLAKLQKGKRPLDMMIGKILPCPAC